MSCHVLPSKNAEWQEAELEADDPGLQAGAVVYIGCGHPEAIAHVLCHIPVPALHPTLKNHLLFIVQYANMQGDVLRSLSEGEGE